ncbi:hypothetical protein GCM10009785_10270 [Brooklawnia cerclae]
MSRETTPGEDGVDQRPPHTSVAVRERMDGLELSVDQPGLNDGRVPSAVEIRDEIIQQQGNA